MRLVPFVPVFVAWPVCAQDCDRVACPADLLRRGAIMIVVYAGLLPMRLGMN